MKRRHAVSLMGAAGATAAWRLTAADVQTLTLKDPGGAINVAVLISEGATIIDFCGPWEVFQDVMIDGPDGHRSPFNLYTVAQTADPIVASAGMKILPNHTFDDAPRPHVLLIPAQGGRGERTLRWIRDVHSRADVVLSVCTGAFLLAESGLLKGLVATTHHDFHDQFARRYPDVELRRGKRFVENPAQKIASAGGLSSGIDLALRVVERYFGRAVAQRTAAYMEYESRSWMV